MLHALCRVYRRERVPYDIGQTAAQCPTQHTRSENQPRVLFVRAAAAHAARHTLTMPRPILPPANFPMAKTNVPEPLLRTPEAEWSGDEWFKINSKGIVGPLPEAYRDNESGVEKEVEFLSKSHGIYLEYNRAQSGTEKDWIYMIRASIPGGGAFTAEQWRVFSDIADKYGDHNPEGGPSVRLTTRQNIQYHWIKKPDLIPLIQDIASTGFYTMNGCGDNVRNVMGCPLSRYSTFYNANDLAHVYGAYFRIPSQAHIQVFAIDPAFIRDPEQQYTYGKNLLNRKFKIAFSAAHRNPDTGEVHMDNCVELRTNEVGIAPYLEGTGSDAKVVGHFVYVGGGQGEKNGKPTFAGLGQPLGIFAPDDLMPGLKAIVDTHKDWGDRKNRHWARMKYVVQKQGIQWFRDEVTQRGGSFELPDPAFDPGPREMHFGWTRQESNGLWAFGQYIECGRLIDRPGSQMKSMVTEVLEAFPGTEVTITANQDLMFHNVDQAAKADFEAKVAEYGSGSVDGRPVSKLRSLSGACVGLPTCRLSYTDSERFEPKLMDELEDRGLGDIAESIGITGCERQCFRPGTKTLGWVGQGPDQYALKLGGSEDGRHQGQWVTGVDPEKPEKGEQWYLRRVSAKGVAAISALLLTHYRDHRLSNGHVETMGEYLRRLGNPAVLDLLRSDAECAEHLAKTFPMPFIPQNYDGIFVTVGESQ